MELDSKEKVEKCVAAIGVYQEAVRKRAAAEGVVQDKLAILKNTIGVSMSDGQKVLEEATAMVGRAYISGVAKD